MIKALYRILGQFKRGAQRYNAESRAFREMERQQTRPVVAPKHPTNLKHAEHFQEEVAEFAKKHSLVDKALDERLQKVFVTSNDPEPIVYKIHKSNVNKPLPVNRDYHYHEMGYQEPLEENVPVGRISFRKALEAVAIHRADPVAHPAEAIAQRTQLDLEVTKQILHHFKSFGMHVPNPDSKANTRKLTESPHSKESTQIGPYTDYPQIKAIMDEAAAERKRKEEEKKQIDT